MLNSEYVRSSLLMVSACAVLSLGGCDQGAEAEARMAPPPDPVLPQTGWTALPTRMSGAAEAKRKLENGAVSITEDFDGDGKTDQANLVMNAAAGLYAVEVQLASGTSKRLASGPLAEVKTRVLRIAPRGHQTRNCDYFNAEDGAQIRCGLIYAEDIQLEHRGINLFDVKSRDATFVIWREGKFETVIMDGPESRPIRPDLPSQTPRSPG
jgi:hypothetical protein